MANDTATMTASAKAGTAEVELGSRSGLMEAVRRRDVLDAKTNYGSMPFGGGVCPSCGGILRPDGVIGAMSRKDGKTEICSACGLKEAHSGIVRA